MSSPGVRPFLAKRGSTLGLVKQLRSSYEGVITWSNWGGADAGR
jgi:hypothetical protein